MRSDFLYAASSLSRSLMVRGVPHTIAPVFDGYQFTFPWCEGDVIIHSHSYGHEEGQFETMGFPWDRGDVTGYLSNIDVISKIEKIYAG